MPMYDLNDPATFERVWYVARTDPEWQAIWTKLRPLSGDGLSCQYVGTYLTYDGRFMHDIHVEGDGSWGSHCLDVTPGWEPSAETEEGYGPRH